MEKYLNSPYKKIPDELLSGYTMNRKIPIFDLYCDDSNGEIPKWTKFCVDSYISRFTINNIRNNTEGRSNYGNEACLNLLNALVDSNIRNKKVAVVGSRNPWIEAILLNLENNVTTIEYNIPITTHDNPNLTCKGYFEFFVNNINTFDAIVSFSSIEHSGLGRYGDPLDPDGDIKTMQVIHNNLKQDGLLIWGAPVGKDCIAWNAHRVYGEIRLPLLFKNFKELHWYGHKKEELLSGMFSKNEKTGYQPVVVLKKN